jgi:phosphatidylserine/phosphatidylglycerophosphate/cardiolipin synthase-like enzyme
MRGQCCIILILILLPFGQCVLSSPLVSSSQDAVPSLVISEVLPRYDWEHIGIENQGAVALDLTSWSITDGEGSWTFEQGIILGPGEEAFIGNNLTFMGMVHPNTKLLNPTLEMIRKGRLVLADEGDEVFVRDNAGKLVDLMAFGKSSYSGEGWHGGKCPVPPPGHALARYLSSGHHDTDTSADWTTLSLGRSDFDQVRADALVEAFLCPEDMRGRIVRELRYAQSTIEAAVYIISDRIVAGALASASERGLTVRILVEGMPVGGLTEDQIGVLEALSLSGCDVRQLQACAGFKRYDYLHCKYLIVDCRRVLMASENWASESLDRNRGWGVSVESHELAEAYRSVFEHDFDDRYPDIKRATSSCSPVTLIEPGKDHTAAIPAACRAAVENVLAPDFSYEVLLGLIQGARDRLLIEVFYISDQWPADNDVFFEIANAARRGVSVRLLLDGSWYNNDGSDGNDDMAASLNDLAVKEGLDLKAKLISPYHPFSTLHNKGAVVDDAVLICSINWVRASFEENRETGMIVHSAEVSGFFARAFESDWLDDVDPPVLTTTSYFEVEEREELVLNASCSDNSGHATIMWDVGADGVFEGEGPFLVVNLPAGEHIIKVVAKDSSNNSCFESIMVRVSPRPQGDLNLVVVGAIATGIVLWRLRRRLSRRSSPRIPLVSARRRGR